MVKLRYQNDMEIALAVQKALKWLKVLMEIFVVGFWIICAQLYMFHGKGVCQFKILRTWRDGFSTIRNKFICCKKNWCIQPAPFLQKSFTEVFLLTASLEHLPEIYNEKPSHRLPKCAPFLCCNRDSCCQLTKYIVNCAVSVVLWLRCLAFSLNLIINPRFDFCFLGHDA